MVPGDWLLARHGSVAVAAEMLALSSSTSRARLSASRAAGIAADQCSGPVACGSPLRQSLEARSRSARAARTAAFAAARSKVADREIAPNGLGMDLERVSPAEKAASDTLNSLSLLVEREGLEPSTPAL